MAYKSSSSLDPEVLLKKLRRLESNSICPNCGTHAPQGIGFGSICVKFKTFVCDLCKTSHQAISHRVKSVSMSTWTYDEVNELTAANNGGNDACRHNWLKNAPDYGGRYQGGVRPKAGDKVDIFKQFVIDCYERGMFKASTPYVPSSDSVSNSSHHNSKPTTTTTSHVIKNSSKPVVKDMLAFDEPVVSKAVPKASNDMIDFLSGPPSVPASNNEDVFGSFSSAPSASVPSTTASFDPFGSSILSPVSTTSSNPTSVFQASQMPNQTSMMGQGMTNQQQYSSMPNNMNMHQGAMGVSSMPAPNMLSNNYMQQQQTGMMPMMPMMNTMPMMGMNQMGMNQMGMNQMGMNQMGMNQMGMNQQRQMNVYPSSNMGMPMMNTMPMMNNMNPSPLMNPSMNYQSNVMQANSGSSISTMNMNSPTRGIYNNNNNNNIISNKQSVQKKDAFDFIKLG